MIRIAHVDGNFFLQSIKAGNMDKKGKYTRIVKLDELEPNEGQLKGLRSNPRTMNEAKFELLKQNISDYPEMLDYRGLLVYPMGNGKSIIVGGNMRYRAMSELGIETCPVFELPKDTPVDRLNAYVILDNNGFGEWDWDMLANDWPEDMLRKWGMDVDFKKDFDKDFGAYSREVISPVYNPSDRKPTWGEMFDTKKCEELIAEIDRADIPEEVRHFLREAAHRHTVFNYSRIADYYAQADKSTQELMERSALVIIDFDKAIEYGFVKMTKELARLYKVDYNEDDEEIADDEIVVRNDA